VVAVEGIVRSRPSESVNRKMKTGFIEVNFITYNYFLIKIKVQRTCNYTSIYTSYLYGLKDAS
jgi:aspartyl-tRNA synthetase